MKKDGKYRFTLQFGSDTEEQIKAGELLEQLGASKEATVIRYLCKLRTALMLKFKRTDDILRNDYIILIK